MQGADADDDSYSLSISFWYAIGQIEYFALLISQEEKKFASNIEPTFEPLFTVSKRNGCFQMKANESHAELMGDTKHEFFNAVANEINCVLESRQEDNSCLSEEDAKMVCHLLNF